MKKTFIIAELAQAHDGSLGILHSYIDAVARTGVDAIKFQTHIADAESSIHEPFRVNFSYVDKTRMDYWRRMEFTLDQWKEIKDHCEEAGVEFISSPFSMLAVDWLEELGMIRYKIASGEVLNYLMLDKILTTGKPIILSSGMSSLTDLDESIKHIQSNGIDVSILQCTTQYPTPANLVGLNVISELKSRYNIPVGLSDHSGEIYPGLAAVAQGADIIEVHAVFDKRMFGPDADSSLTIDQLSQLVEGIRYIDTITNNPVNKSDDSKFRDLKNMFGKSLAANKNLSKGAILKAEDLESKKPGNFGIPAGQYQKVIGKKLLKDVGKYEFITNADIE